MDMNRFQSAQERRTPGRYPVVWSVERRVTRRGVLWLGLTCDLHCLFCYDKNLTPAEKQWVPLEAAEAAVERFRNVYGNQFVDLTGGEPTLHPYIYDLVAHCAKIDLPPTCITHGLHLAREDCVRRFRDSGIHDFLISVHAVGDLLDKIQGARHRDASKTQRAAIDNLRRLGIPFRMNVTLIDQNKTQLPVIAKLGAEVGTSVINFITFNPYFEWQRQTYIPFQCRHDAVAPYLKAAIDVCTDAGIEANVRYMPICQLRGYEHHVYNGFQLPYDPHEWDYNSWYDRKAIRPDREWYYHASRQQRERHEYVMAEPCTECSLREVCDGFHSQYLRRWGAGEAVPYDGEVVDDPTVFIQKQLKLHYVREDGLLPTPTETTLESRVPLTQFSDECGNRAGIKVRTVPPCAQREHSS